MTTARISPLTHTLPVRGFAPTAFELTRMGEQHARSPNMVQRGIGDRDVLLEERAVAAPFRQPLAENECVVAEAQNRFEMCPAHSFSSSGMS